MREAVVNIFLWQYQGWDIIMSIWSLCAGAVKKVGSTAAQ